jgi:hypothetical protein
MNPKTFRNLIVRLVTQECQPQSPETSQDQKKRGKYYGLSILDEEILMKIAIKMKALRMLLPYGK